MRIFRSTTSLKGYERLMAAMPVRLVHNEVAALGGESALSVEREALSGKRASGDALPRRREGAKVGRNDTCPCGSGKKFKKCCGR